MTTEIDTKSYELYFIAMNQSLQHSVKEAAAAFNTMTKTREILGLPISDPDGVTSELSNLAAQVAAAAHVADVAMNEAVAGTRKVGYSATLNDFTIEAIAGDTMRLVLTDAEPGFAVVPMGGGEGLQGLPAIVWGGVAVSVVQATAVYFVVQKSADAIKTVARKRTENTIAKTAGQYAKLVQEGKATPDQAKALTDSLYTGSTELAKAAPPPPPENETPGGVAKTVASTATTIAWIGLAAVVAYGVLSVVSANTARKALVS